MSRASSIDVYQADRGLATCFEAATSRRPGEMSFWQSTASRHWTIMCIWLPIVNGNVPSQIWLTHARGSNQIE